MGDKFQTVNIANYGNVVIKKFNYYEKCQLKGKIVNVTYDPITKEENAKLDAGNLFFWSVVFGIKTLPAYPMFYQMTEQEKVEIVKNMGTGENEPEDLPDQLYRIISEFNKLASLTQEELGKKN